jgi:hypothetical protein
MNTDAHQTDGTAAAPSASALRVAALGLVAQLTNAHADAETLVNVCDALLPLVLQGAVVIAVNQVADFAVAMRRYPRHAALQRGCAQLLSALAVRDEAYRTRAGAAGAVELVTAAMRAFPADAVLQGVCANALGNRCAACPQNQARVAAAGAMATVVASLTRHRSNEDVQAMGCYAMQKAVLCDDNATAACAAGGIECIVATMRAHPTAANVQSCAASALGNIIPGRPDAHASALRAGAVQALVAALRAHRAAS